MPNSPDDPLEGLYTSVLVPVTWKYLLVRPKYACVEGQDQDLIHIP